MPYIGYSVIIAICILVGLVAFGKINPKAYPYLLYGIGAGMVLMTSLAGPYLVGNDIHLEYYYGQLHSGMDVMLPLVTTPQGTSIVHTLIAPLLGDIVPLLWVYKLVYPLLFISIPVILYFVFQKWLDKKQSFLASFVIITFPAFFMELPAIARQMVAEVSFAFLLFLLIKSNLPLKYRALLVVICGALVPLLHYSIAIMGVFLLSASLAIGLILRYKRRLVSIGLVSIIAVGAIYFPLAEDGAVARKLIHTFNTFVPEVLEVPFPKPQVIAPLEEPGAPPKVVEVPTSPPSDPPLINRYNTLMRSGLGADFLETTTTGKIFRILQWIFLVLVPIGLWKLRRNKKYWVFAGGGLFLLLLGLVPGFSGLLNITRVVHISLLLLAPAIAIALKPKYLLIILIPYFLFTSGFIFEVTKQATIEEITIPYSVGLSDYRIDLGATITKDDVKIRNYIIENELFPIYSDLPGAHLIGEITGWRGDLNVALSRKLQPVQGYVFVRSRNVWDGTFRIWNNVGCYSFINPEEYGIDWNKDIIYQSGDARILEIR